MIESNRIENKRELTDSLEKEVVAFLNYSEGGIIYLGIDKQGKVIGIDNVDQVQLKIKDRLKNNIHPSCLGLFDVIHETDDNKHVVKIIVASGSEKPYYIKKYGMSEKGCFIRLGSASEPMPTQMIETLFSRRTRNSISRIRSPRQDLSFEQLKIYYNEANLTLGEKFATNLELLTEEGDYNYAAYLLADENGNSVQVAKYAGEDRVDLIESKEYGFCCLVKTCKRVLERLEGIENRIFNKITPRERINISLWNRTALREAVINAIIHNAYATELVPKFEVFSDRLEITSAGAIHPGKEQEDFFAGYSIPCNKTLMRVFKDLDMVEYLGSGMPRILKAYPRSAYHFSSRFIRTTFPINQQALALSQEAPSTTSEKTSEKPQKASEKTSEKILQLLHNQPTLTISELAKEIGVSDRSIERNINNLQKEGALNRVGADRGGYWEIAESYEESKAETSEKTSEIVSEKTSEKILHLLGNQPTLTISDLAKKIGITDRSIERNIKVLQDEGKLQRIGPDKGGYWKIIENGENNS